MASHRPVRAEMGSQPWQATKPRLSAIIRPPTTSRLAHEQTDSYLNLRTASCLASLRGALEKPDGRARALKNQPHPCSCQVASRCKRSWE